MSRLDDMIADDLALTLPLDGRQLIEASAGTGKTYTIAGLYARLVVERNLPVRKILVMTFTRAATEELRQRLRERLALCAQLATTEFVHPDAPVPDDVKGDALWALALLRRALAQGDESAQALADRLRMAVASMDEAAIFTIHAFCQRVLESHASLLEDTVAGAEMVPSDRDLLEDFAVDFWLRVAGSSDADELAALRQLAGTPDALAKLLSGLITFDGEIEPVANDVPPAADDADAWQALLGAWQSDDEAAMMAFAQWHDAGHLHAGRFKQDAQNKLRTLVSTLATGRHPGVEALKRYAHSRIADAVKSNKPAFPEQSAFAAIDHWLDAHEQVEARCRAWLPVLLHRAVAEARLWLLGRKRDLARMSYDDLIMRLARGVTGNGTRSHALIRALREQYPCALVDEFQDTDARQFGILDALYREYGTLYMIGDPKQAIYDFRGGDVHAYLRAAKKADQCHDLPRNYRSSPAMLRAIEALFSATANPFIEEGIAFKRVLPGGSVVDDALQIDGRTVKPLTLWEPFLDDKGKSLKGDAVRHPMATACANTIAQLLRNAALDGKPLQPRRMAVLTRTNKEAALMQDTLHACGVPAVCLRHESIYASVEARELLRVLDALLVPQSMPRALGALATELMGRTLADLARMDSEDTAWNEALEELAELHERWFVRGIEAMLERLAERHAPRLLALPDGERRLSNLLQLGEILEADGRRLSGERALRDALARHIRDADDQAEDEQLRLESDAECVQIVTLHRCKGLEYDVVLMPFVGLMTPKAPSKGSCAGFHRDESAIKRLILSDSRTREPEDAEACDAAQQESLAESVRTFYVGVTRARHACWIGCGGGVLTHLLGHDGDATPLAADHADIMTVCDPTATTTVSLTPSAAPALGRARTFTRDLPRDWWMHSFSQWAAGAREEVIETAGASDETVGEDDASATETSTRIEVPTWPRGPRYGNAVHAILEKTDFASWREAGDVPPASALPLMARELRAAGYAGDEEARAEAATARLVAAALNVPVIDDVRLMDLSSTDRCAEMAFHFGIADADPAAIIACLHEYGYQRGHADYAHLGERLRGLMTGIIDLVFRHAGQWWIVDYKTNNLGPHADDYAPEKLPKAIAAHDYDLQYLIYTVALHRWLRLSLGDAYDYDRDVGGVRYLFLRGMTAGQGAGYGVYADKPPRELIETLNALLEAPREVTA